MKPILILVRRSGRYAAMDEQMVNELFTPHNWENYTVYARSIFIAIHEEQLESGKA